MSSYGVSAIREAVRKRVEETSLRAVAREVGMSASGLRTFLGGTKPHPSTVQMVKTYLAKEPRAPRRRSDEEVEVTIALLKRHHRDRRIKEVVNQLYGEVKPPR